MKYRSESKNVSSPCLRLDLAQPQSCHEDLFYHHLAWWDRHWQLQSGIEDYKCVKSSIVVMFQYNKIPQSLPIFFMYFYTCCQWRSLNPGLQRVWSIGIWALNFSIFVRIVSAFHWKKDKILDLSNYFDLEILQWPMKSLKCTYRYVLQMVSSKKVY